MTDMKIHIEGQYDSTDDKVIQSVFKLLKQLDKCKMTISPKCDYK
jgi:hypothetical protein